MRFFQHTKDMLRVLEKQPLLNDDAKTLIQDLFQHKYDIKND